MFEVMNVKYQIFLRERKVRTIEKIGGIKRTRDLIKMFVLKEISSGELKNIIIEQVESMET